MLRAAVPEAAVHKQRQARFPENKIGFAEEVLISTPAGYTMLAE